MASGREAPAAEPTGRSWRRWVHDQLDVSDELPPLARIVVALIALTIAGAMLRTMPRLEASHTAPLAWMFGLSTLAFTAEYAARVWAAPEQRDLRFAHPVRGRLAYVLTPLALLDLVALAPWYLWLAFGHEVHALVLLRIFRLFRLGRYLGGLDLIQLAVLSQLQPLLTSFKLMLGALLISSSIVYLLEREAQPDKFGSIPAAMWWAVSALTTVGYGDVVPITPAGRIFGGLVTMGGVAMFALPAAILATGFARELRQRNFATSATTLAALPPLGHLTTFQITRLAGFVEPRRYPPRFQILRAGELVDGLYVVTEGRVLLRSQHGERRLGPHDHFGDHALAGDGGRDTTAVTLSAVRALYLPADAYAAIVTDAPAASLPDRGDGD